MADLGDVLTSTVVVAPMAGGPSTPQLVVAAARAGALALLAGAYRTPDQLADDVAAVPAGTDRPFGVNLFVPGPPARDPAAVAAYVARLAAEGHPVGPPTWDDDGWEAKVARVVALAPAVVTFTFGLPGHDVVEALAAAGSVVGVTVTTEADARAAVAAGASFLCVQGPEAGGHRSTFVADAEPDARPVAELVRAVAGAVPGVALVAAGGVAGRADVVALLDAGATAVQCGTAFLRCPEAGTSAVHRASLADADWPDTAITRAYTGRPARGLRTAFMDDHADAPAGFPEVGNATRPLRALGDPARSAMWAGTGWRHARGAPVADVLADLEGSS